MKFIKWLINWVEFYQTHSLSTALLELLEATIKKQFNNIICRINSRITNWVINQWNSLPQSVFHQIENIGGYGQTVPIIYIIPFNENSVIKWTVDNIMLVLKYKKSISNSLTKLNRTAMTGDCLIQALPHRHKENCR